MPRSMEYPQEICKCKGLGANESRSALQTSPDALNLGRCDSPCLHVENGSGKHSEQFLGTPQK